MAPLFLVAFRSGLGIGELIALQVRDVDVEHEQLHVRRFAYDDQTTTPNSGKQRTVSQPWGVTDALGPLLEKRPRNPLVSGRKPLRPVPRLAQRQSAFSLRHTLNQHPHDSSQLCESFSVNPVPLAVVQGSWDKACSRSLPSTRPKPWATNRGRTGNPRSHSPASPLSTGGRGKDSRPLSPPVSVPVRPAGLKFGTGVARAGRQQTDALAGLHLKRWRPRNEGRGELDTRHVGHELLP
jgi:hypothetical protein